MKTFLLIFLVAWSFSLKATESVEKSPRLLRHLLDYIALDYSGAVEKGKIVSKPEYAEQIEFANTAMETAAAVPALKDHVEIGNELAALKMLMVQLASPEEVALKARSIGNQVILLTKMEVAPVRWPDLHQGKKIYEKNCSACHGQTGHGDGPAGGSLDPKPTDFHSEKVDGLPPFQMFNTIRLGVNGTAMAAFSGLSDQEVWDVAFFALSLRHGNGVHTKPSSVGELAWTLKEVSIKSDVELRASVAGSEVEKRTAVSKLRLHTESKDAEQNFILKAIEQLELAKTAYREGSFAEAKNLAVLAYLDNVEPIEAKLRARDIDLTHELENKMGFVRGAIDSHANVADFEKRVGEANTFLRRAGEVLQRQESSPWFTFSVAAGIVLREAFEASLILITLLGVIRSVGAPRAALFVHIGWVSAVFVGGVAWFFSGWVVQMSGAKREVLEGTISFLAVSVLLYFGFWLHRKTEIGKWRTFIQEMVSAAVDKKNLFALGMIAFMGVFREAFETVLFLRALLIESGPEQQWAMAGGVFSSFLLVVILSAMIVKYSARIPVRQLFTISSVVLVTLSVVLIGKAVHSFQETGLIGVTPFPLHFRSDLFGFYPTYETFIPQLILLVGIPLLWVFSRSLPSIPKNATNQL